MQKEKSKVQLVKHLKTCLSSLDAGACPSLVLVGHMGCGKSTLGRMLAQALDMTFVDADDEIARAAGKSITDIFQDHGEQEFRAGEERVLSRLMQSEAKIIATGGGAFVSPKTRAEIQRRGVSIWLNVGISELVERTAKRNHRPLLHNRDPFEVFKTLSRERNPLYAQADISVHIEASDHEETFILLLRKINDYLCRIYKKDLKC